MSEGDALCAGEYVPGSRSVYWHNDSPPPSSSSSSSCCSVFDYVYPGYVGHTTADQHGQAIASPRPAWTRHRHLSSTDASSSSSSSGSSSDDGRQHPVKRRQRVKTNSKYDAGGRAWLTDWVDVSRSNQNIGHYRANSTPHFSYISADRMLVIYIFQSQTAFQPYNRRRFPSVTVNFDLWPWTSNLTYRLCRAVPACVKLNRLQLLLQNYHKVINTFHTRATLYASAVYATTVCLSVCLLQLVLYRNGCTDRADFYGTVSTLGLSYTTKIRVASKINVSSETGSQTVDVARTRRPSWQEL